MANTAIEIPLNPILSLSSIAPAVDDETFLTFLKQYYAWLQSTKIVFSSTTGNFNKGEIVVGFKSKARAIIDFVDNTKKTIIVRMLTDRPFDSEETVTSQSSGINGNILEIKDNVIREASRLRKNKNQYTSSEQYLDLLKEQLNPGYPSKSDANRRLLINKIRDIAQSKSTEEAYEFLFKAFFNESIEIRFPGDDLLRVSDGKFEKTSFIRVLPENTAPFPDGTIFDFLNKNIRGSTSGAVGNVVDIRIAFLGGIRFAEFNLKLVSGQFLPNETIFDIDNTNLRSTVFGIISGVDIVEGGSGYLIGDTLNITGDGFEAAAVISSVESSEVKKIDLLEVGYGYQLGTEAIVTSTGFGGEGLTIRVTKIKEPYEIFSNGEFITVGEIEKISTLNRGSGYTRKPQILLQDFTVSSLGLLSEKLIDIANSGTDYSVGDQLIFVGGSGANAVGQVASVSDTENFLFEDDTQILLEDGYENVLQDETWSGIGSIVRLELTNFGDGYTSNNLPTVTVSSNTGFDADLVVTGIQGVGANVGIDTSNNIPGVGSIRQVEITNPGLNYSTANIDASGVGDGNANLQPIISGFNVDIGNFTNDDGKISFKIIQDSIFYQDFSYVIKSGLIIDAYKTLVKETVHPAGLEFFGEIVITSYIFLGANFISQFATEEVERPFVLRSFVSLFDGIAKPPPVLVPIEIEIVPPALASTFNFDKEYQLEITIDNAFTESNYYAKTEVEINFEPSLVSVPIDISERIEFLFWGDITFENNLSFINNPISWFADRTFLDESAEIRYVPKSEYIVNINLQKDLYINNDVEYTIKLSPEKINYIDNISSLFVNIIELYVYAGLDPLWSQVIASAVAQPVEFDLILSPMNGVIDTQREYNIEITPTKFEQPINVKPFSVDTIEIVKNIDVTEEINREIEVDFTSKPVENINLNFEDVEINLFVDETILNFAENTFTDPNGLQLTPIIRGIDQEYEIDIELLKFDQLSSVNTELNETVLRFNLEENLSSQLYKEIDIDIPLYGKTYIRELLLDDIDNNTIESYSNTEFIDDAGFNFRRNKVVASFDSIFVNIVELKLDSTMSFFSQVITETPEVGEISLDILSRIDSTIDFHKQIEVKFFEPIILSATIQTLRTGQEKRFNLQKVETLSEIDTIYDSIKLNPFINATSLYKTTYELDVIAKLPAITNELDFYQLNLSEISNEEIVNYIDQVFEDRYQLTGVSKTKTFKEINIEFVTKLNVPANFRFSSVAVDRLGLPTLGLGTTVIDVQSNLFSFIEVNVFVNTGFIGITPVVGTDPTDKTPLTFVLKPKQNVNAEFGREIEVDYQTEIVVPQNFDRTLEVDYQTEIVVPQNFDRTLEVDYQTEIVVPQNFDREIEIDYQLKSELIVYPLKSYVVNIIQLEIDVSNEFYNEIIVSGKTFTELTIETKVIVPQNFDRRLEVDYQTEIVVPQNFDRRLEIEIPIVATQTFKYENLILYNFAENTFEYNNFGNNTFLSIFDTNEFKLEQDREIQVEINPKVNIAIPVPNLNLIQKIVPEIDTIILPQTRLEVDIPLVGRQNYSGINFDDFENETLANFQNVDFEDDAPSQFNANKLIASIDSIFVNILELQLDATMSFFTTLVTLQGEDVQPTEIEILSKILIESTPRQTLEVDQSYFVNTQIQKVDSFYVNVIELQLDATMSFFTTLVTLQGEDVQPTEIEILSQTDLTPITIQKIEIDVPLNKKQFYQNTSIESLQFESINNYSGINLLEFNDRTSSRVIPSRQIEVELELFIDVTMEFFDEVIIVASKSISEIDIEIKIDVATNHETTVEIDIPIIEMGTNNLVVTSFFDQPLQKVIAADAVIPAEFIPPTGSSATKFGAVSDIDYILVPELDISPDFIQKIELDVSANRRQRYADWTIGSIDSQSNWAEKPISQFADETFNSLSDINTSRLIVRSFFAQPLQKVWVTDAVVPAEFIPPTGPSATKFGAVSDIDYVLIPELHIAPTIRNILEVDLPISTEQFNELKLGSYENEILEDFANISLLDTQKATDSTIRKVDSFFVKIVPIPLIDLSMAFYSQVITLEEEGIVPVKLEILSQSDLSPIVIQEIEVNFTSELNENFSVNTNREYKIQITPEKFTQPLVVNSADIDYFIEKYINLIPQTTHQIEIDMLVNARKQFQATPINEIEAFTLGEYSELTFKDFGLLNDTLISPILPNEVVKTLAPSFFEVPLNIITSNGVNRIIELDSQNFTENPLKTGYNVQINNKYFDTISIPQDFIEFENATLNELKVETVGKFQSRNFENTWSNRRTLKNTKITGTVTFLGTSVFGSNTEFLNDFFVNDSIIVNGEKFVVKDVSNSQFLEVNVEPSENYDSVSAYREFFV